MLRLAPERKTYRLLFPISIIGLIVLAQGIMAQPKRKSNKHTQRPANRFEPGKPINLSLKQCSVTPAIKALSISATNLEIEGERITLTNSAGDSIVGEVKAYARSAYRLDANVGLILGRMNVPFTDPSWKPPTIISLLLVQDRSHPAKLFLKAAEGLNPDFPPTTISCESVDAGSE